jgi:hypothetical protein
MRPQLVKEVLRIFYSPKFIYRIHRNPPLIRILTHTNPTNAIFFLLPVDPV